MRAAACLLLLAAPLGAQGTAALSADSLLILRTEQVLQRVRRLSTADLPGARALADSLVGGLPADASRLPDALFARASIAPSATLAEQDYSRIATNHPFSPRAPEALMRLGTLHAARQERAPAIAALDRLLREYSDAPVRARASLLAGQLRLDGGDPARGCDHLAAAWAAAGPMERDVREQATALGRRCPESVELMASRQLPPLGVARGTPLPAATATRATAAPAASRATTAAATSRRDTSAPPVRRTSATRPATPAALPTSEPATTPTPTSAPNATPAPASAPGTTPARTSAPTATPTPAPSTPSAAGAPAFAVQFAAYPTAAGAEQFAATLRQRGIPAHVEGTRYPFRVRAGRFTTRTAAEQAAAEWRRAAGNALVVDAGSAP